MIRTEYYKDLTKMNTFGMKVKARCFMEYDSVADLVDIEFEELARPVLHIGGGSNLLFTDDFKGTVLHSRINFIEILDESLESHCEERNTSCNYEERSTSCHCEERSTSCHYEERSTSCHCEERSDVAISSPVLVSVGAGVVFDDFCEWAAKEGLWGVENLSYIPGEVGASAVQNIGAYGVEVKDVIRKVYCYDTVEEEFVNFSVEECGYGYRDSIFKNPEIKGRYIVTHVVFALSREPQPKLDYGHLKDAVAKAIGECQCVSETHSLYPALIRKTIIRIRKEKLPEPSVKGSAGSFFKNPVVSQEHFARIEAAAKAEHGPDYNVPHYVVSDPGTVIPSPLCHCEERSSSCHCEERSSSCHCEEQSDVAISSPMVKIPAAWMIEQCGWKGKRSGGAAVWEKQPLVIVNYTGEAYPEEIVGLEKRIIASVKAKFGVDLHPEVEHV